MQNREIKKIRYFKNIIGDPDLLQEYQETILQLLRAEYQSAALDLKQLGDHRVFTAWANDSDRLLFLVIKEGNDSHWMLVDVILNHDYQKCKFFRNPALFNQFLNPNKKNDFMIKIDESSFKRMLAEDMEILPPAINTELIDLEYVPNEYHKQTFIEFSDEQKKIYQKPTTLLPLVIDGIAGSGKSCLALSLFTQCVEQNTDDVLFIACSPDLIENTVEYWETLPQSINALHAHLHSYEEWYKTLCNKNQTKIAECVKAQFGIDWVRDHVKNPLIETENQPKKKNTKKSFEKKLLSNDSPDLIYQEFRIMAAYTREEYVDLGNKQSLFHETAEQEYLWSAYLLYLTYLKTKNKIDLSVCDISHLLKDQKPLAAIIVDESQDFSHLQIKTLKQAALHIDGKPQIAFCTDSNQNLNDIRSKTPFITHNLKCQQISLSYCYRCAPNITKAANIVLDIKNELTGGLSDKQEKSKIQSTNQEEQGEVYYVRNIDEFKRIESLQGAEKTVRFAVITSSRYKEQAKKEFGTDLVFTVEEIKGLEYDYVVVDELLEDKTWYDANKKLKPVAEEKNSSVNRAKGLADEEDNLRQQCNQLFTAFTRAIKILVIKQKPDKHNLNNVTQRLTAACTNNENKKEMIITPIQASTTEEWMAEAEKQAKKGNAVLCEEITAHHKPSTPNEGKIQSKVTGNNNKKSTPKKIVNTASKPKIKPTEVKPVVQTAAQNPPKKTWETYVEGFSKSHPSTFNQNLAILFNKLNWPYVMFTVNYENKNLMVNILSKVNGQDFYQFLFETEYNEKSFFEHILDKAPPTDLKNILFETLYHGKSLFEHACSVTTNEMLFKLFEEYEVYNKIDKKIPNNPEMETYDLFYQLIRTTNGQSFLKFYIKNMPSHDPLKIKTSYFIQNLASTYRHIDYHGKQMISTPISILSLSVDHIQLLNQLLEQPHPIRKEYRERFLTTLCNPVCHDASTNHGSALAFLCLMGEEGGFKTIEKLSERMVNFIKKIGSGWFASTNEINTITYKTSPVHYMLNSGNYTLLKECFSNEEASQLSSTVLFDSPENKPCLFNLLLKHQQSDIIFKQLATNHQLTVDEVSIRAHSIGEMISSELLNPKNNSMIGMIIDILIRFPIIQDHITIPKLAKEKIITELVFVKNKSGLFQKLFMLDLSQPEKLELQDTLINCMFNAMAMIKIDDPNKTENKIKIASIFYEKIKLIFNLKSGNHTKEIANITMGLLTLWQTLPLFDQYESKKMSAIKSIPQIPTRSQPNKALRSFIKKFILHLIEAMQENDDTFNSTYQFLDKMLEENNKIFLPAMMLLISTLHNEKSNLFIFNELFFKNYQEKYPGLCQIFSNETAALPNSNFQNINRNNSIFSCEGEIKSTLTLGLNIDLIVDDFFKKWLDQLPKKTSIPISHNLFIFKIDADNLAINSGPNTPGIQIKKINGTFLACNNVTAGSFLKTANNAKEQLENLIFFHLNEFKNILTLALSSDLPSAFIPKSIKKNPLNEIPLPMIIASVSANDYFLLNHHFHSNVISNVPAEILFDKPENANQCLFSLLIEHQQFDILYQLTNENEIFKTKVMTMNLSESISSLSVATLENPLALQFISKLIEMNPLIIDNLLNPSISENIMTKLFLAKNPIDLFQGLLRPKNVKIPKNTLLTCMVKAFTHTNTDNKIEITQNAYKVIELCLNMDCHESLTNTVCNATIHLLMPLISQYKATKETASITFFNQPNNLESFINEFILYLIHAMEHNDLQFNSIYKFLDTARKTNPTIMQNVLTIFSLSTKDLNHCLFSKHLLKSNEMLYPELCQDFSKALINTNSTPCFSQEKALYTEAHKTHTIKLIVNDPFTTWFNQITLKTTIHIFGIYSMFKSDADTLSINSGPRSHGIQIKRTNGTFLAFNNIPANQHFNTLSPKRAESDAARIAHLIGKLDELQNAISPNPAASSKQNFRNDS